MEQPPYMPPAPAPARHTPWTAIILATVFAVVVVGYMFANMNTKAAPKTVTVTQAPPTPSPVAIPDPVVVADPMDDAIIELHEVVYVQQFCNMVDRTGIDDYAQLIEIGKPWRTNSIGSAWVAAQNQTGYPITKLATEFYSRYC